MRYIVIYDFNIGCNSDYIYERIGTWNSANMDAALSASNMRWYSSQYNPYGIELSDFIGSTATLGKTVANADAITNPVDYIARVIHKESSNVPPRLKDIYGVAQTIKNRGGRAINVVKAQGSMHPRLSTPRTIIGILRSTNPL